MTTAPSTPAPTTWTTRTLLEWISGKLEERAVDSPRRMAELLLAHVIGCDRLRLYMETDRLATDEEKLILRDLVKRAMNHEPIQYLVGKETFYSLEFKTDARALIPRPSSQTIIDEAIRTLRPAIVQTEILPQTHNPDFDAASDPASDPAGPPDAEREPTFEPEPESAASSFQHASPPNPADHPPLLIADVCTGSGCLAITLAKNLPGARLIATDLSADALTLAAENAEDHSLSGRIEFAQGDLLGPLKNAGPFDAIVSNPPYIPDSEWDAVEPNVKDHEPELALRAGPDALRLVSPLIEHGPGLLKPGGVLLIELASCSAADALKLAQSHPLLENAKILKDIDGLDRVLAATRVTK